LNFTTLVFGHANTPKNSPFGGFALSVTGTSWHMNACGSPIQAMSLLLVRSLALFIVANNLILLI
jgi:hypothetical protein